MKLRFRPYVIIVLMSALLLSGCLSQPSEPTNYYVLEFEASVPGAPAKPGAADGEGAVESGERGPAVIIQDADVAPMFDRRQLLQRLEGPHSAVGAQPKQRLGNRTKSMPRSRTQLRKIGQTERMLP